MKYKKGDFVYVYDPGTGEVLAVGMVVRVRRKARKLVLYHCIDVEPSETEWSLDGYPNCQLYSLDRCL